MSRIVFVWLPLWPIERMIIADAAQPAAPDCEPGSRSARPSPATAEPFALVASGAKGLRLSALNRRALAEGLRVGMPLNDARAGLPALITRPAEPTCDRSALARLALWCGRYGPGRNAHGMDGLWVDSTGVAHLYGGEPALIADLTGRLARFGITARAAIADTFGAAYALARFATHDGQRTQIAGAGETAARIAGLPVEALRLEPDHVVLLKRLGLQRVGQLAALPRPALARRFREGLGGGRAARAAPDQAVAVLARLDQALGLMAEPLRPMAEPPAHIVRCSFAEPLLTAEGVAAAAVKLAAELCARLADAGEGARRFTLGLYRADGTAASASAGTSRPSRDAAHILKLLGRAMEEIDAGFGIDVVTFAAGRVEPLAPRQAAFVAGGDEPSADALAQLVDRLAGRLGAQGVIALSPGNSHLPERAWRRVPAFAAGAHVRPAGGDQSKAARPPFLLPRPEPIMVLAAVPEGAPQRFTWRRRARRVMRAEGPERIAPEWWREIGVAVPGRERDYYRLEDEAGGRYWVFRRGRYGSEEAGADPPGWFMHGLFA